MRIGGGLTTTVAALAVVLAEGVASHAALAQPTENSVVGSLRAELDRAIGAHEIPGATVVVVRDGQTLVDETRGWADAKRQIPLERDAIFRLYSMSKPITSVAIMMLAEQGKLRLDDPAERYLPELKGVRAYASGEGAAMVTEPTKRLITIADLLTHRSGITYHFTGTTPVHRYYRKHGVMRDTPVGRAPEDGAPARSLDQLVARIGKAPLLHQPGQAFAYSYATTLLGAVIERATGERIDRYLARTIFVPMGMKDSGFFIADSQLLRFTALHGPGLAEVERPETSDYRDRGRLQDAGGALVGTADDYLRFAQMLAHGGTLHGVRLLRPESVDALFTPRIEMAGQGPFRMQFGYGFSIGDAESAAAGVQPADSYSWSGSGNTYFFIDRRRKAVALLMTHILGDTAELRAVFNRAATDLIAD